MIICKFDGCNKQACFGFKNTNKALYCSSHKEIDHINIVSKTCKYDGCNKIPNYGIKNTKLALFCVEHKEIDHVDTNCIFKTTTI